MLVSAVQRSRSAMRAKSLSRVRLFVTPWTVARRLLCPWDSPGKNTGVGCNAVLQGIFPNQRSNSHIAGGFSTTGPPGKPYNPSPLGLPHISWTPPLQVITEHWAELPALSCSFPLAVCFTRGSVCMLILISQSSHPSPSPPPWTHVSSPLLRPSFLLIHKQGFYTHTHIHICIYICICMCVCVSVKANSFPEETHSMFSNQEQHSANEIINSFILSRSYLHFPLPTPSIPSFF